MMTSLDAPTLMDQLVRAMEAISTAPSPREVRIGPGTKDRLIRALGARMRPAPFGIDQFYGVPIHESMTLPIGVWILVDQYGEAVAAGVLKDVV